VQSKHGEVVRWVRPDLPRAMTLASSPQSEIATHTLPASSRPNGKNHPQQSLQKVPNVRLSHIIASAIWTILDAKTHS
jgi:hypothetical protein